MDRILEEKSRLQFITHFTDGITYLQSVQIALDGGCRWVQLRMKDATADEIRPIALRAKDMCHEHGAVFIIDDHVELVKEIGADGVHLGKNDMPVDEARRILGDNYIIGGTSNTIDDVRLHVQRGADYIGCGPFRFTTTKANLSPMLGLEGYRHIVAQMRAEGINIPIVAIGGIEAEDIPGILATGVTGVALSGTVLRAANPVDEMKRLVEMTK